MATNDKWQRVFDDVRRECGRIESTGKGKNTEAVARRLVHVIDDLIEEREVSRERWIAAAGAIVFYVEAVHPKTELES